MNYLPRRLIVSALAVLALGGVLPAAALPPATGKVILTITGKIGEIDAENGEVRIDLTAAFNDTVVLGKAQARVRL